MRRRDERGMMAAVEAAVIVPALVLVVGLVVVLARDGLAQQAVASAAVQAARAVSVERNPAAGAAAAHRVAASTLAESGVGCRSSSVDVDASGLVAPFGSLASVSVTVHCEVVFDVTFPGFPASRMITQTGTSPVDSFRSW